MPWTGDEPEDLFSNVVLEDLVIPEEADITDAAVELLYMFLEKKPVERATPDEIKCHRFFGDV
jgi:hypothetical protein